MKLIIFGATGGTGLQVVQQALELGHTVTAFVRNPGQVSFSHERLTLVAGDVLDSARVQSAMQGQEVVMCALGAKAKNQDKLRARGTKNIIAGMHEEKVRRLICLSALGCGESHTLLPFHYKYLICPFFLKHVYRDHEVQETYVRESKLDWTIIRPAALTDGQLTRTYLHGELAAKQPLKMKISRADVADLMLNQVSKNVLGKALSISY